MGREAGDYFRLLAIIGGCAFVGGFGILVVAAGIGGVVEAIAHAVRAVRP